MTDPIAPADLAFQVLRIVVVLNLGLAAALLLVLVASLICCGVDSLNDWRAKRLRTSLRFLAFAALFSLGPAALRAQTEQDVPEIEPTFTRIFGSDTLEIYGASMSPDGRWILFPLFGGAETMNVGIVSADGGEPARLTDGDYMDGGAQWFPTSDRIAFRSDRQGHWAIMTMPIDRQTGRPTGPPRPVTLEGSSAYFGVSPDGKWIAYTPRDEGQRVIRIVPSNGGTARTLVAANTSAPLWAPDGRHIYYPVRAGSQLGLVRIAVEGGEPDTVITAGWVRLGHSSLLLSDAGNSRDFVMTTLTGEPRARFHLPGEMRPPGLTGPDSNNQFLATMSGFGEALHILPVDGGPVRKLTEGNESDKPLAWTDGDQILFSTELNGNEVLLLAPAEGGAMHQVSLPEARRKLLNTSVPPPFLSRDGSHLFYEVDGDDPEFTVLKVLSLESGTIEEVTSTHPADGPGVTGPGGVPHFDGPDFLYVEGHSAGHELRAWTPEGGSRRLWTFGVDDPPSTMSIHGDRLVFARESEQLASLRIAAMGDTESRELFSVSGWLQSAGWSPNGQYVAVVHVDTSRGESARLAFQQVSPSGDPVGDLRYVGERSLSWWNLRWLPDGSGVLATGWDDGNVWFFPVDPGESPVCLTQDNPKAVREFVLSPDGRHIVYPSRVPRGSSIWLVDLGDVPGGSN
jgi:Tol biopolymer transport system component